MAHQHDAAAKPEHKGHSQSGHAPDHGRHGRGHYAHFGIELVIDFIIMLFVMYTMIANLNHLYLNINNLYMTLMMVAPMAIVMLISMRSMFPNRRANWMVGIAAAVAFAFSFYAMRTQAAVGDVQFSRSMIPHHSGAILMCEEAQLTDREITALCQQIITSQQNEINQMEAILQRYER